MLNSCSCYFSEKLLATLIFTESVVIIIFMRNHCKANLQHGQLTQHMLSFRTALGQKMLAFTSQAEVGNLKSNTDSDTVLTYPVFLVQLVTESN